MLKAKSLLMKKTGNKPSAKNVTTELQLEHPSQQQKRQPQQPGNRQPQDPAKRQPQQPAKRQPQPPQLQQLEASQQRQPQPPLRSSESADHDMSSKGKKTRGVTKGIGTHDIVTAANERILIQMNEDQKLPNGVQANSKFVSEIGSRTRSLAPLHVKKWKEVTLEDKDEITKGLLFGDRDISDWEWLCDNLYTDQAYQNRCRINTINRNRKIYNHCGGSRPFTKHMEAEEQKGKNVTFIENWSLMHQHRGNNGGVWINEEAEKTGKKLTGEFIKTKQQLADSEGTPFEDVIVPIPVQLDILAKELGTMNGKTIRGVGYGLKKDTFCPSVTGSTSNPTNAQLMRYIVLLERATCFS